MWIIILAIIIVAALLLFESLIDAFMTRCSVCGTEYKFAGYDEKAYCPNEECPEYPTRYRK